MLLLLQMTVEANEKEVARLIKKIERAADTSEKDYCLSLAKSLDIGGKGFFWGNAHLHIRNFGSIPSAWHAALRGYAEGASYLEICDFFDPFGFQGDFERTVSYMGITPIAGTEIITIVDEDFKEKIRAEFGLSEDTHLKFNGAVADRLYLIISGFPSNFKLSTESLETLSRVRKKQTERVQKIAEKTEQYLQQTLGFAFSKKNMADTVFLQERDVALAVIEAIMKKGGDSKAHFDALGIGLPGPELVINSALIDSVRIALFGSEDQPCYEKQSKNAFLSIDEAKNLANELDGILKLPVILNGKKYSVIDETPEMLCRFCELLGVYAISWVDQDPPPENARQFTEYFYNKGFLVDMGSEHNDMEEKSLLPEYKNGEAIEPNMWEMLNRGACIDIAQMHSSEKFLERGTRTTHSPDILGQYGMDIIHRIKANADRS